MALKDWKNITNKLGEYEIEEPIRHAWLNTNEKSQNYGQFVFLKRRGKNYYIDTTPGIRGSIIIATGHHPQDPIESLKKAKLIAKKFMRKH